MVINYYQGNRDHWWISIDQYPYLSDDEARSRQLPEASVPDWLQTLAKRVLTTGGMHMVVPPVEDDYTATRSQTWVIGPDIGIKRVPGAPSACHRNVVAWYDQHAMLGERAKIVTGYALTASDKIWRQHSWGLWLKRQNRPTIIETTESRSVYVGVALSAAEAEQFARNNA